MKNTLIIFLVLMLAACSSNSARIENEIVSRPAVEQRALTSAMENAFSDISFGTFKDIKTHVEVQGLSDRDLVFVKGYIENRILSVGGGVTRNIDDATYRVNLVLNVIGGDRVGTNYYIFSTERVIGEGIISPRIPTTMFNGYEDEVANLYSGMDLKKNY